MIDTEYLLCLKELREGTQQFQMNSCALLEKHQQELYDGGAFILISINVIYPDMVHRRQDTQLFSSLLLNFHSCKGGGNTLRLSTAKSKQSLQPLLYTSCCKLVPQELSTSLEGRFGQDDLQKFLPMSIPF